MSWSIAFWNLPPEIKSPLEIPQDFKLLPLGSETEVLSIVAEVFPETEVNLFTEKNIHLHNLTWLTLFGENFSLMFSLDRDDTGMVCGLDLNNKYMNVSFENLIDLLRRLCEHTGWCAVDMSLGMFITFDAEGLQSWKNAKYRIADPTKPNA